jgi:hypothetical protein
MAGASAMSMRRTDMKGNPAFDTSSVVSRSSTARARGPNSIGLELRDVRIAVERMEAARGMPTRTGGELLALAQCDILPAQLGQMVEDTAADDTAADNERLNM